MNSGPGCDWLTSVCTCASSMTSNHSAAAHRLIRLLARSLVRPQPTSLFMAIRSSSAATTSMTMMVVVGLVLALLAANACAQVSIMSFGAVPNDASNAAAAANTQALTSALYQANITSNGSPRVVIVPANMTFVIFNVVVVRLWNVTLQVDGVLAMSNNITAWPTANGGGGTLAALYIGYSNLVTIQGSGSFDGQGYDWWWYVGATPREPSSGQISISLDIDLARS
mgnify:FL=1